MKSLNDRIRDRSTLVRTREQGQAYEATEYIDEQGHLGDEPEIDDVGSPMHVMDITKELPAPEFGSVMTYTVPAFGTAQPIQVLQRRVRRVRARVYIDALAGGATGIMYTERVDNITGQTSLAAGFPGAGLITAVPRRIDWQNQRPLYLIAIGGGPVFVTVQDEAYAEPEPKER